MKIKKPSVTDSFSKLSRYRPRENMFPHPHGQVYLPLHSILNSKLYEPRRRASNLALSCIESVGKPVNNWFR